MRLTKIPRMKQDDRGVWVQASPRGNYYYQRQEGRGANRKEEYHLQKRIVKWLDETYPNVARIATGAGLYLGVSLGKKMKDMGYQPGTPDLILLHANLEWCGLLIELKTESGKVSDKQNKWTERVKDKYLCVVIRDFETAKEVVREYLGVK